MPVVLLVFGTRPEAIKMAPVYFELARRSNLEVKICVTGQHREMLDQVCQVFGLVPDYDLNVMSKDQSMPDLCAKLIKKISAVYGRLKPDMVLIHGDTMTTLTASIAAYFARVPIGHIEAGLRSYDIYSPWPEEFNRRVASIITKLHFAPTKRAFENLVVEGIPADDVIITGNTVIDALMKISSELKDDKTLFNSLERRFKIPDGQTLILVTGHRRESFGQGFKEICLALKDLALSRPEVKIVYPVHLNPNVRAPVNEILDGVSNVDLIEPLSYTEFTFLMMKAFLILTDSGGIQEEAPALNKPVLVMRDTTERPEALEVGVAKLVGTDRKKIFDEVCMLLNNPASYNAMAQAANPFGDGTASVLIANKIEEYFS